MLIVFLLILATTYPISIPTKMILLKIHNLQILTKLSSHYSDGLTTFPPYICIVFIICYLVLLISHIFPGTLPTKKLQPLLLTLYRHFKVPPLGSPSFFTNSLSYLQTFYNLPLFPFPMPLLVISLQILPHCFLLSTLIVEIRYFHEVRHFYMLLPPVTFVLLLNTYLILSLKEIKNRTFERLDLIRHYHNKFDPALTIAHRADQIINDLYPLRRMRKPLPLLYQLYKKYHDRLDIGFELQLTLYEYFKQYYLIELFYEFTSEVHHHHLSELLKQDVHQPAPNPHIYLRTKGYQVKFLKLSKADQNKILGHIPIEISRLLEYAISLEAFILDHQLISKNPILTQTKTLFFSGYILSWAYIFTVSKIPVLILPSTISLELMEFILTISSY